ncbi:MAG: hypothetical protein OXF97_00400 [Nitrospira sp.]|nr:hypothetical protein [Nitrospira sp.]
MDLTRTFRHVIIAPDGKEELPFFPFVYLQLNLWSRHQDHDHLLTAQLINEREIDAAVETLKRDLDRAGRRAKDALKRAKAKERSR